MYLHFEPTRNKKSLGLNSCHLTLCEIQHHNVIIIICPIVVPQGQRAYPCTLISSVLFTISTRTHKTDFVFFLCLLDGQVHIGYKGGGGRIQVCCVFLRFNRSPNCTIYILMEKILFPRIYIDLKSIQIYLFSPINYCDIDNVAY